MASFITRVERAAPIFSRITGLIRSGQMKWENRPLWYDVYAAVPPFEEPVWDIKMPKADEPVRSIMYKEDLARARFYSEFRNSGVTAVENSSKPTLCEQFILQIEVERKSNPEMNEDELFERFLLFFGILKQYYVKTIKKTIF
uniref:Ribosomal protein S23 mitochondrial conserved domain-containing protein n=1 Tax=Panagrolaimus sp. PS1159 TaxID=55785 RepID=A0AC35GBZ9_9BILA